MPELPDVAGYVAALADRLIGRTLVGVRIGDPFLVRTADPPLTAVAGRTVREVRRVGKRIAIGLDGDLWLVVHLMIAGRLHWKPPGAPVSARGTLAALDVPDATLTLTEAGTKRRASLHVLHGASALEAVARGGIDVFAADLQTFREVLAQENHTLKRALTDPTLIDGVGNAYSDEILHAARLSPLAMTKKLTEEEWQRLFTATRATLQTWIDRFVDDARARFPEKVTAFRPEMAVHGKYGKSCPACGTRIERIRYADNETNYCPTCQTGGKILADRALSRLLGPDFAQRRRR